MRTIVNGRWMLAGLALLAVACMSACSANRTPKSAGPGSGQTTTPPATATSSPAAPPAIKTPGAMPTAAGSVRNLVITSSQKSELTAAYVAFRGGISLSDVAGEGPTPGSAYYAYEPAHDTYWALAYFAPSATASFDVKLGFQDGGGIGEFQKVGMSAWHAWSPGVPPFCGEAKFFPQAVLTDWGMSAPAGLTCATTRPGGVQNLVLTSAEKSELTAAYVAFRGGISLSDVAGEGPAPGSAYYAYDQAADTHWALAYFAPSATASLDVSVGFQDGGGIAMFQKVGAGAWNAWSPGVPPFCGEAKFFPQAVLTVWGMSTPAGLTC